MVYTTLYFFAVLVISGLIAWGLFWFKKSFLLSMGAMIILIGLSSVLYFSFLDNYLARHWGGSMIVKLPANAQMIGMTWKDNSLWYQYYLPETNECVFREDSQVGIVEGEVRTPNCNPVGVSR